MLKLAIFVLCLAALANCQIMPMLPKEERINWMLRQWIDPVIVGGEDAEHGEFPHMLQFQVDGDHQCGASIIHEQYALTAAHCFKFTSPDSITLVAGQHKLKEDDETEQERKVEQIIIHPKYGSAGYDYDIAIIKVSQNFTFNYYVQPIALYSSPDPPKGKARTSGWGRLSADGSIPNILQKLDVNIYEDQVCQEAYGSSTFTENMICAGNIEGGHCVCSGDSGSALYSLETDKPLQIGIVSWGNPCAIPEYPAAYAEVGVFIDFVREHVPGI